MEFYELLNRSCENVELGFDEVKYNQFIKYKELLKEWNEKVNLTAIVEDDDIIKKHFIDSINIFKFKELVNCKSIIDVGTGAGFPGLPIKIVMPEMEVTLLDSLNKRLLFLDEVIKELKLEGVTNVHSRAEDGARTNLREAFDCAVSRGVANLAVLTEYCLPYVKVGGYFIALKGPSVEEEIATSKKAISKLGGSLEEIINVEIEGTDLKHNLVIIKKISRTPDFYPRQAGLVTRKPLK